MKPILKYYREFYVDGIKGNFVEIGKILGIRPATVRNIYNFEQVDTRDYKGHELSFKYVHLVRIFNINGRITERAEEAAAWLGIGRESLKSYMGTYKNGWSFGGNTVTFRDEFREVDYSNMKKILRPRDRSELIEVDYTHDVIEINGVKIVRKMSGDTLIKSFGWSVGQKKLKA